MIVPIVEIPNILCWSFFGGLKLKIPTISATLILLMIEVGVLASQNKITPEDD
jgi:hypothetical protein